MVKMYALLTLEDELRAAEKKNRQKPTVERMKTKREEKYNKFVKQLHRTQRKKDLK
jgi:hypothetical protein